MQAGSPDPQLDRHLCRPVEDFLRLYALDT